MLSKPFYLHFRTLVFAKHTSHCCYHTLAATRSGSSCYHALAATRSCRSQRNLALYHKQAASPLTNHFIQFDRQFTAFDVEMLDSYLNKSFHVQPQRYRCPVGAGKLAQLSERSDASGFQQAGGHLAAWCFTGMATWHYFAKGEWVKMLLMLWVSGHWNVRSRYVSP
jgi:hypothetical protein